MKLLLSLGLLGFSLSFCNPGNKSKTTSGSPNSNSNSSSNSPAKSAASNIDAEKPLLSDVQQKIVDDGAEVKWDEQEIAWRLPSGWKKTGVKTETPQFKSPDGAFLIPAVSVMPNNFPSDMSMKGTYESAMMKLHSDTYELARYLEIDGIKGVEWRETMPGVKSAPRRHQWTGFRQYRGQNQQINIILSTKGSDFDRHRNEFLAIMYSMKIGK
ncbi:MAG: hypothetical protein ABIU09_01625 [Pyrinomonadaceae bacterium]